MTCSVPEVTASCGFIGQFHWKAAFVLYEQNRNLWIEGPEAKHSWEKKCNCLPELAPGRPRIRIRQCVCVSVLTGIELCICFKQKIDVVVKFYAIFFGDVKKNRMICVESNWIYTNLSELMINDGLSYLF